MTDEGDSQLAPVEGPEEPLPTTLRESAAFLLYQAARQLGDTLDPEKVYDRLHELLLPVIPHDGLVVSSYDPADGLIRCEYAWVGGNKLDPATLPPLTLNPQGEGMQSRVILTGESRLINDVAEQVQTQSGTYYSVDAEGHMRKLPETGPPPTKAAMMVPTKLEGQVLGVVQVMNDHLAYTAEQLELLEGIVAQLAAAVRNAKLYEELRRERELLQKVFDKIPVMITLYRPNIAITQLNREFERLTGWTTEEARQQIDLMAACYPDPAYREEVRAYMDSLSERWKDIEMTTREGNILESSWSNIRLTDDTHVGIGIDIGYRKQAEREREQLLAELQAERGRLQALNETLEQQVRERTAQVRKLAADLTIAEQQERRQLGQDLHDSAGQLLTALQIYLKLIDAEIPEELEPLRQRMKEAEELTDQVYQEVRSVSHAMRPPTLDKLGLDAALDDLCREFGRRTGLLIAYQGCELPPVNDQVGITFYRFLQEALSNIVKHAQASTVQIRLAYREGNIYLEVEDNGLGFEPERMLVARGTAGGIGLRGLTERFQLLGGQIEIDSGIGKGTRLTGRYQIEENG
jgi:PAS domain S-box-containing protein